MKLALILVTGSLLLSGCEDVDTSKSDSTPPEVALSVAYDDEEGVRKTVSVDSKTKQGAAVSTPKGSKFYLIASGRDAGGIKTLKVKGLIIGHGSSGPEEHVFDFSKNPKEIQKGQWDRDTSAWEQRVTRPWTSNYTCTATDFHGKTTVTPELVVNLIWPE